MSKHNHQFNHQPAQPPAAPKSPWTQEIPTEPAAYFYQSKRWGRLVLELKDGVFTINCAREGVKVVQPSDGLWCRIPDPGPIPEGLL